MPLYDFACKGCGTDFEDLVRGDEVVQCPSCGTAEVERLLGSFAVRGGRERNGGGAPEAGLEPGLCGTCGDVRGPGACALDG